MKNKLLCALSGMALLGGCMTTSPMPDSHYQWLSDFAGNMEKCFEGNYINPKHYADSKNASFYMASKWSVDVERLKQMTRSAYSQASATPQKCRQIEAASYQMIAQADQSQSNERANNQAINDTLREINRNKPVYCNQIGTTTMCN